MTAVVLTTFSLKGHHFFMSINPPRFVLQNVLNSFIFKKVSSGKKKVICYLFQFIFYVGVYICIYISLSLSLSIYIYQCTQYIPNFTPGHFPKLRNTTLKNNNKPDHYLFFKRYYKIVFFF